jgi:hypothetical protein
VLTCDLIKDYVAIIGDYRRNGSLTVTGKGAKRETV